MDRRKSDEAPGKETRKISDESLQGMLNWARHGKVRSQVVDVIGINRFCSPNFPTVAVG